MSRERLLHNVGEINQMDKFGLQHQGYSLSSRLCLLMEKDIQFLQITPSIKMVTCREHTGQ